MKVLISLVISLFILYLLGAIVLANFNIMEWSQRIRVLYVCLSLVVAAFIEDEMED